jgi:hypothetical protein
MAEALMVEALRVMRDRALSGADDTVYSGEKERYDDVEALRYADAGSGNTQGGGAWRLLLTWPVMPV